MLCKMGSLRLPCPGGYGRVEEEERNETAQKQHEAPRWGCTGRGFCRASPPPSRQTPSPITRPPTSSEDVQAVVLCGMRIKERRAECDAQDR